MNHLRVATHSLRSPELGDFKMDSNDSHYLSINCQFTSIGMNLCPHMLEE